MSGHPGPPPVREVLRQKRGAGVKPAPLLFRCATWWRRSRAVSSPGNHEGCDKIPVTNGQWMACWKWQPVRNKLQSLVADVSSAGIHCPTSLASAAGLGFYMALRGERFAGLRQGWLEAGGFIGEFRLDDDLIAARVEAQMVVATFQAVRTERDLGHALGNLLRGHLVPKLGPTARADFTISWP